MFMKIITLILCLYCGVAYSQSRIGHKKERILSEIENSIDTVLNGKHRVIFKSTTNYTHFYFLDSCGVCIHSMIICLDDFGKNLLVKSFDVITKRESDSLNVWFDEVENVYIYLLFNDDYKKYYFWFEKDK